MHGPRAAGAKHRAMYPGPRVATVKPRAASVGPRAATGPGTTAEYPPLFYTLLNNYSERGSYRNFLFLVFGPGGLTAWTSIVF